MAKAKKEDSQSTLKLKQALNIINKELEYEEDFFKLNTERDEDYFETEFISTGSPWIDYRIGGGWAVSRLNILSGWEGTGKTSLLLCTARTYLDNNPNMYVVYFDSEYSVNKDYMERFGLWGEERFLLRDGANLERFLNEAKKISRASDVGVIIVDSIRAYLSSVVIEKDAEQDTVGIEARKWNAHGPIIVENCRRRNIALICTNQWREDITPHGTSKVLSRGHWQDFHKSIHLDLGRKTDRKVLPDNEGHIMTVSLHKSRFGGDKKADKFDVKFYYDKGFDMADEYANILSEEGVIKTKKGGHHYLPDGTRLRGIQLRNYLADNPDKLEELINMIGKVKNDDDEANDV